MDLTPLTQAAFYNFDMPWMNLTPEDIEAGNFDPVKDRTFTIEAPVVDQRIVADLALAEGKADDFRIVLPGGVSHDVEVTWRGFIKSVDRLPDDVIRVSIQMVEAA